MKLIKSLCLTALTLALMAAVTGCGGKLQQRFSSELEKKAQGGDAAAQAVLGDCYFYGLDVAPDAKKAADSYAQAAGQGDALGQLGYGLCLLQGQGVARDSAKASDNLQKAFNALKGDEQSDDLQRVTALGLCYLNGYGTAADQKKGIELLTRAATADEPNVVACDQLGYCYANALGVARDMNQAQEFFQVAGNMGCQSAKVELAVMSMLTNSRQAVEILRPLVDQGNAVAQYYMSYLYYTGTGITDNPDKAMQLLKQSADKGYVWAQLKLGKAYLNGEGVAADEKQAVDYLTRAAQQNNAPAQHALALYYEGKGDQANAQKWHQAANQ